MSHISVTVITIAYNDLAGLKKTVDSVRNQTYSHVEHVIIDGGSPDDTRVYLESLPKDTVWVSEADRGRYDAMNKGARLSSGKYLWFMHAGDVFGSSRSIESVIDSIAPQTRWGFGLSRVMDADRVVGIFGAPSFDLRRFALGGKPISHQASIIARDLHDQIGGYDENFGLAADQYYLLQAALISAPQIWCEFLCNFDNSGAGSNRRFDEHFRDMARGRNLLGYTSTRSTRLDSLISASLAARVGGQRLLLRLRRRITTRKNND